MFEYEEVPTGERIYKTAEERRRCKGSLLQSGQKHFHNKDEKRGMENWLSGFNFSGRAGVLEEQNPKTN